MLSFALCEENEKLNVAISSTEEGVIISVLVCGLNIFISHRENCRIPHYTKFFGVAMVDIRFLNFNSLSLMAACVQINWFVVGWRVCSALLDINMWLLGGLNETWEVNIQYGSLTVTYKAGNRGIDWDWNPWLDSVGVLLKVTHI